MNSSDSDMKPGQRERNRVILTLTFAVAAVFFFGGGWVIKSKLDTPRMWMAERKQRVMYDVDHRAVLDRCRFIREHAREFRHDPRFPLSGADAMLLDPTDPKMPKVIADLQPTYVRVAGDEIRIEMGDDIYHFGLSYSEEPTKFSMQPLIPNLWFYTQDGVVPDRIR